MNNSVTSAQIGDKAQHTTKGDLNFHFIELRPTNVDFLNPASQLGQGLSKAKFNVSIFLLPADTAVQVEPVHVIYIFKGRRVISCLKSVL